jgi:hypothetical protein
MNSILFERIYPYAIGIAATSCCWLACENFNIQPPSGEEMLSSVVSLGGILAGFLATIKTLLMDMKAETIESLGSSGYSKYLRTYLSEALWSSLALCSYAIAGFSNSVGFDNIIYQCILIGILACALSALYRVTRIGMALLSH